jgi:branched-chain amino acid transport system substrate-binding protein
MNILRRAVALIVLGSVGSFTAHGLWATIGLNSYMVFAQNAPTSPLLDRAKAELEAGKSKEAITTLERLIDSFPPPEILQEAYFLQATALKQDNQPEDALTVLKQLLEEFPFSLSTNPARVLMAQLYIGIQDYEHALSQLYQALDYSTDLDLRRSILQLIRQTELDNNNHLGAFKSTLN